MRVATIGAGRGPNMMSVVALVLSLLCYSPTIFSEESRPSKTPFPPSFSVTDLVREAERESDRHNYKKVVQLVRNFSEAHPDQYLPLRVRVHYSRALAGMGDLDEAIRTLQEVVAEMPPQMDLLKIQYDLANLLFMQRRYQEAKVLYEKILLQSSRVNEVLVKARERLALMKERASVKKEVAAIQLLDLESSLEAGEVPDGAMEFLQKILDQTPPSPHAEQAKRLSERVREVRTERARALLDEARRLFDEERKYLEVREILENILQGYSDVTDRPSVEALMKEVNRRLGG